MPECHKCPYFAQKKIAHSSGLIIGFCNLRNMYIPEKTINNSQCKDKAYVSTESLRNTIPLTVSTPAKKQESSMVTF